MRILAKNKRAHFDYEIEQQFDCGIVLAWHEVKATKVWQVNLSDSFVRIMDNELFLLNMNIPLYTKTAQQVVPLYEPKWKRKLLITKKELTRIAAAVSKSWLTMIPLKLREAKNRRVKITIWLAKRKRKVEKKQHLKERDTARQMDKDIKRMGI